MSPPTWMRDDVIRVIRMGVFPDPRIAYYLSPAELQAACDGYAERQDRTIDRNSVFFGTVCAAIYNVAIGRKRNSPPVEWSDIFRPRQTDAPIEPQSPEIMKQKLIDITRAFGGTIRGKRR